MKTTILLLFCILILVLGIYGWKWVKVFTASNYHQMLDALYSHSVPLISPDSIHNLEDYIILDARADNEYQVSMLPNAQRIGYDNPNFDLVEQLPKDKAILVYCSVGYRSEKIGEQLLEKGFTNVHNLYGGIFEWVNTKHDVVNSQQDTSHQVHGYSPSWGKWIKAKIDVVFD